MVLACFDDDEIFFSYECSSLTTHMLISFHLNTFMFSSIQKTH